MCLEELINRKKEEIIEEVKRETKRWSKDTIDGAMRMLEAFATELKETIDMQSISAADLLKIIEKGGLVLRKGVDVKENYGRSVSLNEFMEDIVAFEHRGRWLDGKQRVTLIIEPMEE